LNTVLFILFSLNNYTHLALDPLTIRPLENFFRFVRWDANNLNTANEMTGTIAHTNIAQEADGPVELEEHAHHRVNLAGVHIDDTRPHAKTFHIEMPTNLDPETIAGMWVKVAHVQHGILSDEKLVALLQFPDYLTLVATDAAASRTSKEIKQRFRSGSGSRIVSLLLADRAPASDGPDHEANPHSPASDKAAIPKGQAKQIETPNP
jgi:hypothetical protein